MMNTSRREQFLDLMEKSGWDLLLLYGNSWRKDFFRSLVNFNFFGPHALAALDSGGELSILLAHPWDKDPIADAVDGAVDVASSFTQGLDALLARTSNARMAIAGMELM